MLILTCLTSQRQDGCFYNIKLFITIILFYTYFTGLLILLIYTCVISSEIYSQFIINLLFLFINNIAITIIYKMQDC